MMNQNNGGDYETMIRELGRVITYIKENPKEFKKFCVNSCPCSYQYGCKKYMSMGTRLDRSKCPIYGSEDPVADFDKQFKLALIKGDI